MKNGQYLMSVAPESYPGKKYRGRYAYDHHLVWWLNNGEVVSGSQVVHHKNENKHDNRIENLELLSQQEHSRHHGNERADKTLNAVCSNCSKTYRVRPFKLKQKFLFCSRRCIGLFNFPAKSYSTVAQR